MMLLLISLVMKANMWTIINLFFVFKFVRTKNTAQLLIRINSYLSVSLAVQYIIYWLNLNWKSSIQAFPKAYEHYPDGMINEATGESPLLPFFFKFRALRQDLLLCYMLGIGVDKSQVRALSFDFINLFVITMYVFVFRNPILNKNLSKVFWQFPTKDDQK